MSWWTFVNGSMKISTYNKKKLKEVVEKANTMITGSEGPCEIHIVHLNASTGSSSYKYKGEYRWKEHKNLYVLTFNGSLRDRCYERTKKEFEEVIELIDSNFYIEKMLIQVRGDYDENNNIYREFDDIVQHRCFNNAE